MSNQLCFVCFMCMKLCYEHICKVASEFRDKLITSTMILFIKSSWLFTIVLVSPLNYLGEVLGVVYLTL